MSTLQDTITTPVNLRPASRDDIDLLRAWEQLPHVRDAGVEDWDWEYEVGARQPWGESFIAQISGRPIGFVQIIDPHLEPSHYWGDIEPNLRAIDIWIGPAEDLGKGFGGQIMRLVIDHCFADSTVQAIILDPLARNVRAHRFYQRLGFRQVDHRWFDEDECFVFRLDRPA